ncbi:LysR family transcriptional regulator [Streptomyces ipomoeae]|uniref:LysR family transcriptional regulator n=1 Tax=Streptomyces ipomoeae TaxID=103232 RepID=A0AAE9B2E5_9ACTN|nr:LysR family transcriptional regulator [Streptomyces ipomoeae]MDX2819570.1 LysR family transcriptional regulator [Streptomyces ipomoeae]MDX2878196.1 LysR family transcriptional regulator [Streptomyces ipomoeae]TQE32568.1 LysR family transcriptional regulator [Streptomyces ipomoeae]TQE37189.1 LysR family transcriptional regulator [Streptomyces ipomoeae]
MTADFSLRQLEYFVAVAATGSMSAAAVQCHASQAGISTAIADLERRLGVQLLVRRRAKGVFLTEAGTRVLEHAQAVLALAEDLRAGAKAEKGQLAGRLTIGCYATLSPFLIPPLVDGFTRLHPAVDLRFLDGSQQEIRQALLEGACDLAFLYETGAEAGLTCTTVRTSRPYVILPPRHPLADRDTVSLAELADEPLIVYADPPAPGNAERWTRSVGVRPNIRYSTSSIEAVRSLVARGLGYSMLVQRWPTETSFEGLPLVSVPLSDVLEEVKVVIAHASTVTPTPRARSFAQYARETLAAMDQPPS